MFDYLKRKFTKQPLEEKPKIVKPKAKTAKELATEAKEPYVNVISVATVRLSWTGTMCLLPDWSRPDSK
jgi:hypothetical protein